MDAPGPFQFRQFPISDGMEGIYFQIGRMKDYVRKFSADPNIIEFARTLIMDCPPKDLVCEIQKIHKFVGEHVRFVQDPVQTEVISTPVKMLNEIRDKGRTSGDCDELSTFEATLLAAVGMVPRFRFGGQGKELYHVWVQVQIDGGLDHGWEDLEPSGYLPAGFYYGFPRFSILEIFE